MKIKAAYIIRFICIVLLFSLSISTAGCKSAGEEEDGPSSSDVSSINDGADSSSEPTEQPTTPSEDIVDTSENVGEEYEEYDDGSILYSTVNIQNGSTPIIDDFFGLNAIYQGYTFMDDFKGRKYTERQAKTELDRIGQMGMKMVRSYYGSKYAYDAKTGGFNWESSDMTAFYRYLRELQDRDIEVGINAGWSLDSYAYGEGWDVSSGVYVEGDFEKTCRNYTSWMIESLKQFKAHGCYNVKYLFLFTEPGEYPGGVTVDSDISELTDPAFDEWLAFVKALDGGLKSENMRSQYKFVGPNETNFTEAMNGTHFRPMFYQAIHQANDYIDIYSHHIYVHMDDIVDDSATYYADYYWRERAAYAKEMTGKPFWIDEFNIRDYSKSQWIGDATKEPLHAVQHAAILSQAMDMGIQNLILWTVADQQWPNNVSYSNDGFVNGVQCHGVLPSLFETSIPKVSYYGISLLTKYFGEGKIFKTTSDGVYAACQQGNDGNWTIMAVNLNYFESEDVTFNFEKSLGGKTFYRHIYNSTTQVATAAAKLIGADKKIKISGTSLNDIIPPCSFAIYTTIDS